MTKRELSVDAVRKVCEALVANKGDVYETSVQCNINTELVKRIKFKKIYKAISDSYFQLSDWGETEPGVREPDEVKLNIDPVPENTTVNIEANEVNVEEETKTATKKRHRKPKLTNTAINKICKELASGTTGRAIAKKFGVAHGTVSNIKLKYRYKEISDKYFVLNEFGNIVPVSDVVRDVNNTVQINLSSSDAIINEIYDLTAQLLMKKPIEQLPDRIQEKILLILKEEVDNMSIKDIKEMIINE